MPLSLDSIIAEARAAVAQTDARKAAEARAKGAKTEAVRTAALTEAQELRALADWRPVALVYRQELWKCACGHSGCSPDGLFIFEERVRMAGSTRLIRPRHESDLPELPRRVLTESRVVIMCHQCSPASGFDLPHNPPARERKPLNWSPRPLVGEPARFADEWTALRAPASEQGAPNA